MSDTLYVTPAQVLAAKLALELSEAGGEAIHQSGRSQPSAKPEPSTRPKPSVSPPVRGPRTLRELNPEPEVGVRGSDLSQEDEAAVDAFLEERRLRRAQRDPDIGRPGRGDEGSGGGVQR
jgi:hypothetical protein